MYRRYPIKVPFLYTINVLRVTCMDDEIGPISILVSLRGWKGKELQKSIIWNRKKLLFRFKKLLQWKYLFRLNQARLV